MSLRHAALIAVILLAALLVVGLILLRPMAPENYADGVFSFDAVTQAYVTAGTFQYDSAASVLTVTADDPALQELVDLFDGRGFGRTAGSLFSQAEPVSRVGDRYWSVTFLCSISQSTLTAELVGSTLRLTGADTVTVTTQNRDGWAREVGDLILSLYPEPSPDEDTPTN